VDILFFLNIFYIVATPVTLCLIPVSMNPLLPKKEKENQFVVIGQML